MWFVVLILLQKCIHLNIFFCDFFTNYFSDNIIMVAISVLSHEYDYIMLDYMNIPQFNLSILLWMGIWAI